MATERPHITNLNTEQTCPCLELKSPPKTKQQTKITIIIKNREQTKKQQQNKRQMKQKNQ